MSAAPEISVVMAVYNGAEHVRDTMDSVLAQVGPSFEFIVVDDGSTDATPDILSGYARRDPRVSVITQKNTGLTRALIAGCAAARGKFIARQDCGDRSLPGRFVRQRDILVANPDAVLVSCGTRFIGPEDEELYSVFQSERELHDGLAGVALTTVRGPSHHGSTMFRRAAYQQVGGYRSPFPVAQDLDLWMRLWERGRVIALPEIGYEARLTRGAISMTRREDQIAVAATILTCAAARRSGGSEDSILSGLRRRIDVPRRRRRGRSDDARFFYFIASLLRSRQRERARRYYLRSVGAQAWFLPSWIGLARLWMTR